MERARGECIGARSLGSQAIHLWPQYPPPRAYKGSPKSLSVFPKFRMKDRLSWVLPGKGRTESSALSTQPTACELCVGPGAQCPLSRPLCCLLSSAFYEELLPTFKQSSGTHSQGPECCPILRVCPKAQCGPQPSQTPTPCKMLTTRSVQVRSVKAMQALTGFSQTPCAGLLGGCRHLTAPYVCAWECAQACTHAHKTQKACFCHFLLW